MMKIQVSRFGSACVPIISIAMSFVFLTHVHAETSVEIDPDNTYQIIRGFGANNIMPWRPDMTADEIETAFGTGDGQLGFSILRLRVPYVDNQFSLNVPTAKAAYDRGVTLIASPWTPPPAMKTNNNIVGGELKESQYDEFAAHLKLFADYMADHGAPLYAVSVQNEPDVSVTYESCDWNATQMVKFIKENAPAIGTKVIAPESFKFRKNLSDPILNDPEACANLDIVGGHIYGGGLEPYPLAESKGKEVWMTEHLVLETSWADNLATGSDMNNCMLSGMSAYIWWYIVRFYGPIYDEGDDYRTPPGAVKGEISKRGYVMSQFARFVRPGYYRIYCSPSTQRNLTLTAYRDGESSKIVIVAINTSNDPMDLGFTLQGGSAAFFTPYVTTETKNCNQENSIAVSGGSFSASLEASSVTTFVSDGSTAMDDKTASPAESFNLLQNYPNPFNPVTTIMYSVPENGPVSLKVYDLLGKEVATLFQGIRQAGDYAVTFDGSSLAGGVYLYRLRAGDFTETNKLILDK